MKQLYLKSIYLTILSIICISASAYDCKMNGIFYNLDEKAKTASVTYKSSNGYENEKAYKGSVNIPSIFIYNGTAYSVTSIGDHAFHECTDLTFINIPSSVTSIDSYAFEGCSGMTSIEIPTSVTSIGKSAFQACSGLISVVIPSSVTSIGESAFWDCSSLTSVKIGYSVKSIGDGAFVGCSSLKSIDIPSSVTSIGNSAFFLCRSLNSVTIPYGITTIGNEAFFGCSSLTSIMIPNSVTTIGEWAFCECSGLTSIRIPNGVTSIGPKAFTYCSGLTNIVVETGNSVYDSRNNCNAIIEKASNTLIAGCKNTKIPSSVSNLGNRAFMGCRNLTSVHIPDGVTSVGDSAFWDCSNLTSIDIPSSVKSIGDMAFYMCTSLTSIDIPSSVTSIGGLAFYCCTSLTSITIPSGVTSIGDRAFYGCENIGSLIVSPGNTTYDSRSDCNAIIEKASNTLIVGCKNTKIPSSVTSIGDWAFSGCTSLTSVTIPGSVTSIGDGAFYGCCCIVFCNKELPPTAENRSFNEDMIAIVPEYLVSTYRKAIGWRNMSFNSPCVFKRTTQTSIILYTSNLLSNVKAELNGVTYYPQNDSIKITGLEPNTTYPVYYSGDYEGMHLENEISVTTKNVSLDIQLVKRTNLTLNIKGWYDFGDVVVSSSGFSGYEGQNELYIDGLKPGDSYNYTYYVMTQSGKKISTSKSFQTLPVTLNVSVKTGSTSAQLTGSHNVIDAAIINYGFDNNPNQTQIKFTGLEPNKTFSQSFYVVTKEGGKVSQQVTYTTDALALKTSQPKVISAGNVIVAAQSNLDDDEETNVGFEWRRTDWTSDFESNTGTAYLYNGTMEGYIRSLNTEKLWKYRPYFTSNAGKTYYGEWVGIDPTNTSYFEPTVHTYANVSVNGNSAEVKGYVQRGTDNVVSKGFAYWKQYEGVKARETYKPTPSMISSLPNNAKTVEISGGQQVMTASLSDLEYETTYYYVALVRTSEGDTFFGDVRSFETDADLTGVENMEVSSHEPSIEVARYNINGHRISSPQRGINIVRMSDGTTRKVFVK